MKKFGLIALLSIVMLTFSSCSKDKSELIIGKWSITGDSYMSIDTPSMDEPNVIYTGDGSYTWTFAEDGTMVEAYGSINPRTSTYTIDGDILIVNNSVKYTIQKLDNKEMILHWEVEEGNTTTVNHLVFKKI